MKIAMQQSRLVHLAVARTPCSFGGSGDYTDYAARVRPADDVGGIYRLLQPISAAYAGIPSCRVEGHYAG